MYRSKRPAIRSHRRRARGGEPRSAPPGQLAGLDRFAPLQAARQPGPRQRPLPDAESDGGEVSWDPPNMLADICNAKRSVTQSNHTGRQIYTEGCLISGSATNRHSDTTSRCRLSGVKRTSNARIEFSAFDAVDGAHSAASRCHRVASSKRTTLRGAVHGRG